MWYVPVVPKIRGWCWQPGVWHPRVDVLCADWPEPEAEDEDWRAAVLERAATRPCTPCPGPHVYDATWRCPSYYLKWLTHCTLLHPAYSLAYGASCQSTPPVAR